MEPEPQHPAAARAVVRLSRSPCTAPRACAAPLTSLRTLARHWPALNTLPCRLLAPKGEPPTQGSCSCREKAGRAALPQRPKARCNASVSLQHRCCVATAAVRALRPGPYGVAMLLAAPAWKEQSEARGSRSARPKINMRGSIAGPWGWTENQEAVLLHRPRPAPPSPKQSAMSKTTVRIPRWNRKGASNQQHTHAPYHEKTRLPRQAV